LPFSSIYFDARFLASYEVKRKYEINFLSDLFPGVQVASKLPFLASMASLLRLAKLLDRKLGQFELISSVEHLITVCPDRKKASCFILDGYFQNPNILFSEKDRNWIRNMLISTKRSIIDQTKNSSSTIGVHIRRGDYVKSKSASKVFRNIPIEYYDTALQQLRRDQRILVFSDDPELSASYAAKVKGIDVRSFNLSLEEEFCLLMSCDNHIIANSTFSWWAAYLGNKPGGRVISPKNWYQNHMRSQANPLLLPYFELIDA
jgi:hypothetical protein